MKPKYPVIGSKVRCIKEPSWMVLEDSGRMIDQIGIVISNHPADPDYPDDSGAIGIQYPFTPYSDNTIAQDLDLEGVTWERVKEP